MTAQINEMNWGPWGPGWYCSAAMAHRMRNAFEASGYLAILRILALSVGLFSLLVLGVNVSAQPATPGASPDTPGDNDTTALAKKLQNPIGDLYSFPFQNNTNFNTGPNKGTQDILNIQPVIPIHINDDWNVITRTILPLIWQPTLQPAQTVPFGTGPTTFSTFFSPNNPPTAGYGASDPSFKFPRPATRALVPMFGAAVRPACLST